MADANLEPKSPEVPEIIAKASIRRSKDFSDEELEDLLREELKEYLLEKLKAQKITATNDTGSAPPLEITIFGAIKDPEFAALLTAYVSLRSQEKKGKSDTRLQILILVVAAASLVISILALALGLAA